eukprot:929649-Pyramimonas_sp.AAC.1
MMYSQCQSVSQSVSMSAGQSVSHGGMRSGGESTIVGGHRRSYLDGPPTYVLLHMTATCCWCVSSVTLLISSRGPADHHDPAQRVRRSSNDNR